MIVKKNGKTIGTIIVYGDINKDGNINKLDANQISNFLSGYLNDVKDYDIISMDVNYDSIIDSKDYELITAKFMGKDEINQLVEVKNTAEDIIIKNQKWYIDNYISELPETFKEKYNVYYNEEKERYQIDIASGTITAAQFLSDLQDEDAILKVYTEEAGGTVEANDDTPITKMANLYVELGEFGSLRVIYIKGN